MLNLFPNSKNYAESTFGRAMYASGSSVILTTESLPTVLTYKTLDL